MFLNVNIWSIDSIAVFVMYQMFLIILFCNLIMNICSITIVAAFVRYAIIKHFELPYICLQKDDLAF